MIQSKVPSHHYFAKLPHCDGHIDLKSTLLTRRPTAQRRRRPRILSLTDLESDDEEEEERRRRRKDDGREMANVRGGVLRDGEERGRR